MNDLDRKRNFVAGKRWLDRFRSRFQTGQIEQRVWD
ncbi:MAG: hypothetical protein DMF40_15980 [Verrucomicrobia bacterium]|nr:MAG: hypothetical protein DME86_09695 [Verrucomicrobiota bacterium]PYL45202.1 MAG: hypothetical protein DMF40_15980 [Verrucomicrobiota bacterium]